MNRRRIAEGVRKRKDELGRLETLDCGKVGVRWVTKGERSGTTQGVCVYEGTSRRRPGPPGDARLRQVFFFEGMCVHALPLPTPFVMHVYA